VAYTEWHCFTLSNRTWWLRTWSVTWLSPITTQKLFQALMDKVLSASPTIAIALCFRPIKAGTWFRANLGGFACASDAMPWDSTAVRDCHFSTLSIAYGCDPGWTLRLPASGTYIMMIISSRQIDAIHRRLATSWPSWRRHSELFAILHSIRKKAHVSILHWWFSRKEYWLLKPKLATLTVSHTFCGGASQVSSNTAAADIVRMTVLT
jgi:hypothetical protein